MRKLFIAALLGSSASITSVQAQEVEQGWFADLLAGPNWIQTETHRNALDDEVLRIRNSIGLTTAGQVGYDFGPFRLGTEIGYQTASNGRTVSFPALEAGLVTPSGVPQGEIGNRPGTRSALSYMLNGTLDLSLIHI